MGGKTIMESRGRMEWDRSNGWMKQVKDKGNLKGLSYGWILMMIRKIRLMKKIRRNMMRRIRMSRKRKVLRKKRMSRKK